MNYKLLYEACGYNIDNGLRKLSDMTEEEAKQLFSFKSEEVKGYTAPYQYSLVQHNPSLTLYLLKQGFDLFGLIESGQALTKTKI